MAREHNAVFNDVEELKKAIAEEEEKRPAELRESPINAQIAYVMPPSVLPREHANLEDFYSRIQQRFGLTFDDSKLRGITQGQQVGIVRLIEHLIENDETAIFHHGMLQLEQPARTTPILQFGFSNETVAASVIGSTFEAEWVAQKSLEELWAASGVSRSWQQVEKDVQMRSYKTTTRVHLGMNLIDLFSEAFKGFVATNITKAESFGALMGRHPLDKQLLEAEKGKIKVIPHVRDIELQISQFNEVTGRSETCNVNFNIQARHEMGQGIIVVSTELDSTHHTEFLQQLLKSLR